MSWKAIVLRCKPGSRFHFGKHAPDAETALNDSDEMMHSDTLFAALVNTYQDVYGDAQELVDAFNEDIIRISSLYYCFQWNKEYTWFLPKPASFNLFQGKDQKLFRGIRYVSKRVWENLKTPSDLEDPEKIFLLCRNKFAVSASELLLPDETTNDLVRDRIQRRLNIFNLVTLPKVRVDLDPEEQKIFQLTVTEIADKQTEFPGLQVHLYFLMDEKMSLDLAGRLFSVIKLLPDCGIGAERSTIGIIEDVEIVEDWQVPAHAACDSFGCSVSLFSPGNGEVERIVYGKTLLRGGRRLGKSYDGNEKFLKTVRMVEEGAILHNDVKGILADVSPQGDKNYLRNGKPLLLPIPLQWIPGYENG